MPEYRCQYAEEIYLFFILYKLCKKKVNFPLKNMSSQKKKKLDLWCFQNIEIIGQLNSATLFQPME